MIRPAALYNKARFSRDFASLGRVAAVLCGNAHITRDQLTDAELSSLEEIENENEEMDKVTEKERKRKAAYRASVSRDIQQCPKDKTGQDGTGALSAPTEQPNNRTNNQPTDQTTKQPTYLTDTDPKVSAVGSEVLRKEGEAFVAALKRDSSGSSFFDPDHAAVTICAALTGDYAATKTWSKYVKQLGEEAVRQECFTFYREILAGEEPENRGAVLNARLKKMGVK